MLRPWLGALAVPRAPVSGWRIPTPRSEPWGAAATLAAAILIGLLSWNALWQAQTQSLLYDDAYNASVAKNVARGVGYETSYGAPVLFNIEVTTGPAVLLPAALAIRLGGNAPWVPMTAMLALNVLLLLGIGFTLRRRLGSRGAIAFAGALLLLLSTLDAGDNARFACWVEVLGEVPGALMLAFGTALVLLCHGQAARILGASLLGWAMLAKLSCAMGVSAVLTCLLIRERAGRHAWWTLTSAFIPVGLWSVYGVAVLGRHDFWQLLLKKGPFIRDGGSGLRELADAPSASDLLLSHVRHNASELSYRLGGPVAAAALATALVLMLLFGARAIRSGRPTAWAGLALLAASAVHVAWWLPLSPTGWMRHLIPALAYGAVGAPLVVLATPSRMERAALVAVLLGVVAARAPRTAALLHPPQVPAARLQALLKTAQFLTERRAAGDILGGHGWWANRDLEYVMGDVGNFQDLSTLPEDAFVHGNYLLVRSEFWNWDHLPARDTFAAHCDSDTIFRAAPFVVCRVHAARAVPPAGPAHGPRGS